MAGCLLACRITTNFTHPFKLLTLLAALCLSVGLIAQSPTVTLVCDPTCHVTSVSQPAPGPAPAPTPGPTPTPAPAPVGSLDGTQGPTVTDGQGNVYTLTIYKEVLKNGTNTGMTGDYFLYKGGTVYVFNANSGWYDISGPTPVPVPDPSPVVVPPTPTAHNAARANSYDDAWENHWPANGRSIVTTAVPGVTKTDGLVIHVGDSIVLSQANTAWPAAGAGKTAADVATLTWMHASSTGEDNGYNLASGLVTAREGMGWGDPAITAILNDPRVLKARVATLEMNSTDIGTVEAVVNKFIAKGILPVLVTCPPRNIPGYDTTHTIPFNAALYALAERLKLPLIDYYAEILARRPGTTYDGTLIGLGDVHPTGGPSVAANPYTPGGNPATQTTGDATLNSGYLLRSWLITQKVGEIRGKVDFTIPAPPSTGLAGLPLIRATAAAGVKTLSYQGAFNVPAGGGTSPENNKYATFSYGGGGIAYNPARNSLFLNGQDNLGMVGEIGIPALSTGPVGSLVTAPALHDLVDTTNGHFADIGSGDLRPGGLLVFGNALLASFYIRYDAAGIQTKSHWRLPTNLDQVTTSTGPHTIRDPAFSEDSLTGRAGWVSGYMCSIPQAWQATLGGSAFSGNWGGSITSRWSQGPTLTAFTPSQIGVGAFAAGKRLVGYPMDHATLGPWTGVEGVVNPLYNSTSAAGGCVFPEGTRTVLFIGEHGMGDHCYGWATTNPALHHQPHPDGINQWCYDPADDPNQKGQHGYPYKWYVWAYDALELAAVKTGTKLYWEVLPYATWTFEIPYTPDNAKNALAGVGYDPATQRIFVAPRYSLFATGGYSHPIVHVFTVQ